MRKQERADYVRTRLAKLYPQTPIPLDHKDPYTLLVAVLLSAQCTDKRVNEVTPALFKLADNPDDMARKKPITVEKIIKPCGLSPRKSRAIVELSRILVDEHNSEVPESFAALEALPGVGHKTASVVMSQAFGVPAFPVDTHIHRLAQRWGLTKGKNVTQTEADLKNCFQSKAGTNCICKLFFMVASFVRQEDATARSAKYVVLVILAGVSRLRSTLHKPVARF